MITLVRDLMNPGVMQCQPDDTLGQVAKLFAENHVHSLFIFGDGVSPVGVITDYDVMAGEWLSGDPEGMSYIPGLSLNADRDIWKGHKYDATKGRHPNKSVNVGFPDGHVELRKAESLLVRETETRYVNRKPLWSVK